MLGPVFLLDIRVEVVVPSFTALFSDSTWRRGVLPGRFSAMVVHFWGPNLWTSLIRYSSSYDVQDLFFPTSGNSYICYSYLQGCSYYCQSHAGRDYDFHLHCPSFKFKYWRKHFILNLENPILLKASLQQFLRHFLSLISNSIPILFFVSSF